MKIATKRLRNGALLFLALASLYSCRSDKPPGFPICTLDGFGGGDCSDATGELATLGCAPQPGGGGLRYYCPPSKMKNFWGTTQIGMTNYSAWCYGTTPEEVAPTLEQIRREVSQ